MANVNGATVTARGEGEHIWFNSSLMTVKSAGADTQDAFDLVEVLARGGNVTPLHTDPTCETFRVLEGELRVHIAGREIQIGAGGAIVVPAGTPHAFLVTSPEARFLVLNVPGGHDRFFRAGGAPATTAELPPPAPLDITHLKKSATQFGIEILGPPPFSNTTRSQTTP